MAGRPHNHISQGSRTQVVAVRLTPQGLDFVDQARGPLTRSAYLRMLVIAERKRCG